MTQQSTILVTGATGRVGGAVVEELIAAGITPRALARRPEAAALPPGVEVVGGDLAEPDSVGAALAGVDAAFLVFPTLQAEQQAPGLIEAIAAHARQLVYLSAAGAGQEPDEGILGSHARLEALIRSSGLEWTFLRPQGFASNTLLWAEQIRSGDVVRWFHGAAGRSLIHERDIAAVGARTELLAGLPDELADSILAGHAGMVQHPEPVTRTVAELTGRPALTYQQWVTDHLAEFRAATAVA